MNWKLAHTGQESPTVQSRLTFTLYNDAAVRLLSWQHFSLPIFLSAALGLCLLGFSPQSWSQAAAFDVGEAKLYPSVEISYFSSDNIFATRESPIESTGVKVEPRLVYVANKGDNELELGYAGSYLNSDISEANFADHRLFFGGQAALSKRAELKSDITFTAGHVDFGSTLSRGEVSRTLDEPYKYNDFRFNTIYRYGARRARGNVSVGLAARKLTHTNEPDSANPNRTDGLNFTNVTPYMIFSLRATGDTRAFLDLRFDSLDYDAYADRDIPELDNDRIRAFIGSSWDITGRTGGSVKVGTINTTFADSRREQQDNQTVGFELDTFYSFKPYSTIEIGFTRDQNTLTDSQLLGRRDVLDLIWRHEWSTRFSSRFGVQYRTTFSECDDEPDVAGRENNNLTFESDFNVKVRRWVSVGFGYKFDNGKSSRCESDVEDTRDFERNQIDAHVMVTL